MEQAKPECELIGTDGNIFALMGRVIRTMNRAGLTDQVATMKDKVKKCGSYDEAIQVIMEYVEIT